MLCQGYVTLHCLCYHCGKDIHIMSKNYKVFFILLSSCGRAKLLRTEISENGCDWPLQLWFNWCYFVLLDGFFDNFFLTNFFDNFFDEFFKRIVLTNYFWHFFGQILSYNLLIIASFRIGVPSTYISKNIIQNAMKFIF